MSDEKKEIRIISENDVPPAIRKRIEKQENIANKNDKLRKEIGDKLEIIILNNFDLLPSDDKLSDMLNKLVDNYCKMMKNNPLKQQLLQNFVGLKITFNSKELEKNFENNIDLTNYIETAEENVWEKYAETLIDEFTQINIDILKVFSKVYTDKIIDIINQQELSSNKYMGGELKIRGAGKVVAISYNLYFADKRKSIKKISYSTEPFISDNYIAADTLKALRKKGILSFEF